MKNQNQDKYQKQGQEQNRALYQKTFSKLHSVQEIRWEDMQMIQEKKGTKKMSGMRPVKRLFIAAVIVIALAALSIGIAVAADLFGLRDSLLPQKSPVNITDENGVLIPGQTREVNIISLSGFMDTPESRALSEWQAFLDSYDTDEAIIQSIGNQPTGFEKKYGMYLVYTQEMADKLDEITEKYQLKLHQTMTEIIRPDDWKNQIGDFFAENITPYAGYCYEDGSFAFDGEAELSGYGTLDYQFRRSVRGSFHDVILNIEDIENYQDWNYQTASGQNAILALSPQKGLILVNLENCFVTLNVLASDGPIAAKELEALADSFDFKALMT